MQFRLRRGASRAPFGGKAVSWLLVLFLALGQGVAAASPSFVHSSDGFAADGIITAADICSFGSVSSDSANPTSEQRHELCVLHCSLNAVTVVPQSLAVVEVSFVSYHVAFPAADEKRPVQRLYSAQSSRGPPLFS